MEKKVLILNYERLPYLCLDMNEEQANQFSGLTNRVKEELSKRKELYKFDVSAPNCISVQVVYSINYKSKLDLENLIHDTTQSLDRSAVNSGFDPEDMFHLNNQTQLSKKYYDATYKK